MLYLHGGGWMMFSIDTHDRLMREYAMRSGAVIAGIDYSLSPEAKFPVALEEAVAALGWLQREGRTFGIDPSRLAIGGDSAGANLALTAALKLRGDGGPKPCGRCSSTTARSARSRRRALSDFGVRATC